MAQPLYKFLPRRFGEALVEHGNIRITTLYTCRRIEDAGIGRSDPLEHTKQKQMSFDRVMATPENYDEIDPFLRGFMARPTEGRVMYELGTFRREFDGPDLFVYCTSLYRSRRMERRFDSGDDVWVEIFNPTGFFSEVTKSLSDVAVFSREGAVRYRSRTFHPHDEAASMDAALLKDPEFEPEHEWRLLWEPRTRPIDPVMRVITELTRYCRISRDVLARAKC